MTSMEYDVDSMSGLMPVSVGAGGGVWRRRGPEWSEAPPSCAGTLAGPLTTAATPSAAMHTSLCFLSLLMACVQHQDGGF